MFLLSQDVQDFLDDVRKQLDDMKKQSDEMRKLKAIIVKHENRIRALEAALKARDDDVLDAVLSAQTSEAAGGAKLDSSDPVTLGANQMAPDEV